MRFLLDECMPRSSKEVLKLLKHDVLDAKDAGLLGKDDGSYISFASRTKRILITLDKDFANTRIYEPGTNPGIIVLRSLYPSTSVSIGRLLYKFLKLVRKRKLNIEESLSIVSPIRIKIRK